MRLDRRQKAPSNKRQNGKAKKDRLIGNAPFTQIPNAIFQKNCLTSTERLVFCALLSWTRADTLDQNNRRFVVVSEALLARSAGVSAGTVKRSIKELVNKKMIERGAHRAAKATKTTVLWDHNDPIPPPMGSQCAHMGSECALHGIRMIPSWDQSDPTLEEEILEEFKEYVLEGDATETEIFEFMTGALRYQLGTEAEQDFERCVDSIKIDQNTVTLFYEKPIDRDWIIDHYIDVIAREVRAHYKQGPLRFSIRPTGEEAIKPQTIPL